MSIFATGGELTSFSDTLRPVILGTEPDVLAIACAYVSVYGIKFIINICNEIEISEIKLVTDIGDAVTHPEALRLGLHNDWSIRVCKNPGSTFHPKIYFGGSNFLDDNKIDEIKFLSIGSSNLTKGGLEKNTECNFILNDDEYAEEINTAFILLWQRGIDITDEILKNYEKEFAKRNRKRSYKDLRSLGVDDSESIIEGTQGLQNRRAPKINERSITTEAAEVAWAGLQSFTGEYRFQVEFPRDAGIVLGKIIGNGHGQNLQVLCEDGEIRQMSYRYYPDNGMFRLNVPNETPGVDWARQNRDGIALINVTDDIETPIEFKIIRPGQVLEGIVGRSVSLGTWGKTPTRLYGWY